jgi:hypothetical protein
MSHYEELGKYDPRMGSVRHVYEGKRSARMTVDHPDVRT